MVGSGLPRKWWPEPTITHCLPVTRARVTDRPLQPGRAEARLAGLTPRWVLSVAQRWLGRHLEARDSEFPSCRQSLRV